MTHDHGNAAYPGQLGRLYWQLARPAGQMLSGTSLFAMCLSAGSRWPVNAAKLAGFRYGGKVVDTYGCPSDGRGPRSCTAWFPALVPRRTPYAGRGCRLPQKSRSGLRAGWAPAGAGVLVAGGPDDGDHAEKRGERDDQGDEVGGAEVTQRIEGAGEAYDQDGDHDQAPAVQEQAQREGRRGRGHVGHGGDGLRLAAFGKAFADPDVQHQAAGPVGDEEEFVGMHFVGHLGHRAAARRPGHRRPDGGRADTVADLLADDDRLRALDDQLRRPGGRGSPAPVAAVPAVPAVPGSPAVSAVPVPGVAAR